MGVDIYGFVEYRDPGHGLWRGCIDIAAVLEQDATLYGCLFGTSFGSLAGYVQFNALLPVRGMPSDPSDSLYWLVEMQAKHDLDEGQLAPSYGATWAMHGEVVRALERLDQPATLSIRSPSSFESVFEGKTLRDYVCTPGVELLVSFSRMLAVRHGEEHVRWCVFFA
jgi:hypothetical protein